MRNPVHKYGIICPVCGYNDFDAPPEYDDLCPCCFFAFYTNDIDWTDRELRADWIAHGAKWAWGKEGTPKPPLWSAIEQLHNVTEQITDEEKRLTTPNEPVSVGKMEFKDVVPIFDRRPGSIFPAANFIARVRSIVGESNDPRQFVC